MLQLSQNNPGQHRDCTKRKFRSWLSSLAFPLEHVLKKLPDFFGFDIRHPFDFEQRSYRSNEPI